MSIDICIISPTSHLEEFSNLGDMDMSLSHLVIENGGDNDYAEYYRKQRERGRFVLLDNSAFELEQQGKVFDPDIVLDAAEISNPSEVICTDILFDCDATIESTKKFIERAKERGLIDKYQFMAVAQGNSVDSYMKCLVELMKIREIDTIGISKLGVPVSFLREEIEKKAEKILTNSELSDEVRKIDGGVAKAREMLMQLLKKHSNGKNRLKIGQYKYHFELRCISGVGLETNYDHWPVYTGKKFHLLGGDNEWAHELNRHVNQNREYIRSSDSSMPVWYGCYEEGQICAYKGTVEKIIGQKPDLENDNPETKEMLDKNKEGICRNIALINRFSK